MVCNNCGKHLDSDATTCDRCGALVEQGKNMDKEKAKSILTNNMDRVSNFLEDMSGGMDNIDLVKTLLLGAGEELTGSVTEEKLRELLGATFGESEIDILVGSMINDTDALGNPVFKYQEDVNVVSDTPEVTFEGYLRYIVDAVKDDLIIQNLKKSGSSLKDLSKQNFDDVSIINQMLEDIDGDSNGDIDKVELFEYLSNYFDVEKADEYANKFFEDYDTNNSGKIDVNIGKVIISEIVDDDSLNIDEAITAISDLDDEEYEEDSNKVDETPKEEVVEKAKESIKETNDIAQKVKDDVAFLEEDIPTEEEFFDSHEVDLFPEDIQSSEVTYTHLEDDSPLKHIEDELEELLEPQTADLPNNVDEVYSTSTSKANIEELFDNIDSDEEQPKEESIDFNIDLDDEDNTEQELQDLEAELAKLSEENDDSSDDISEEAKTSVSNELDKFAFAGFDDLDDDDKTYDSDPKESAEDRYFEIENNMRLANEIVDDEPTTDDDLTEKFEEPTTDDGLTEEFEEPKTDDGLTEEFEEPTTDDGLTEEFEEPITDDGLTEEFEEPTTDDGLTEEFEEPTTDDGLTEEFEEPTTDDGPTEEVEESTTDDGPTEEVEEPTTDDSPTEEVEEPITDDSLSEDDFDEFNEFDDEESFFDEDELDGITIDDGDKSSEDLNKELEELQQKIDKGEDEVDKFLSGGSEFFDEDELEYTLSRVKKDMAIQQQEERESSDKKKPSRFTNKFIAKLATDIKMTVINIVLIVSLVICLISTLLIFYEPRRSLYYADYSEDALLNYERDIRFELYYTIGSQEGLKETLYYYATGDLSKAETLNLLEYHLDLTLDASDFFLHRVYKEANEYTYAAHRLVFDSAELTAEAIREVKNNNRPAVIDIIERYEDININRYDIYQKRLTFLDTAGITHELSHKKDFEYRRKTNIIE